MECDDSPEDYDRTFTTSVRYRVRRRIGYSHDRGTVTRFVVQLEYLLREGWTEVVRLDHGANSPGGHDVTEEGLHVDVYRDGRKVRVVELTAPLAADDALTVAEEHLNQHADRYIRRFERWHGIKNP